MEICRPWRGITVIVVEVEAVSQIHIRCEVWVTHLQAVIHDGDAHARAFVAVPNAAHIHIRACGATVLPGVTQMPLVAWIRGIVGEVGVIRGKAVKQLVREHRCR